MALDVGQARIGVARSNALGLGEPLATLPVKNLARRLVMKKIEALAREHEIEGFVVGLARNMDGSAGDQALLCEEFAAALREHFPDMPVAMEDERLSTETAMERLRDAGVRGRKAREQADAVAACVIVEDHLARLALKRSKGEGGPGQ